MPQIVKYYLLLLNHYNIYGILLVFYLFFNFLIDLYIIAAYELTDELTGDENSNAGQGMTALHLV